MAYTFFKLNLIPLLRLKLKKIEGLENLPTDQNFILAANHNAWIDSGLFVAGLTKRIKKKIYFISASNKYLGLGTIPIDKKNKAKTIEKALSYLAKGKIIFIYPEGTSNPTKALKEPKTGAARLGIKSRLPVVPLGINNTIGVKFWGSFFWFWFWPKKAKIRIGKPLTFEKFYGKEISEDMLDRISRIIMEKIAMLCGKKLPREITI